MPARGIIVWNSHAFNLTETDSTLSQYLNLGFAQAQDQVYPAQQIFVLDHIFTQDVAPFETQEICATHTLPRGARVFQLSSHTHRHGVQWRTWAPPNTPCQPRCAPGVPAFFCFEDPDLPFCEGPRADDPLYFSTDYSDPLNLSVDLALDSPNLEDRTFLYCSVYDNGATPTSPPVKRRSTAPFAPEFLGGVFGDLVLGGPCIFETYCMDGPNKGLSCIAPDGFTADDRMCDNAPGANDGVCDACPARGGITTEDEMFIMLGTYYLVDPS